MFTNQTMLARFYAVRYKDSDTKEKMLMQGNKQIKLYRKHSRAEAALEKLGLTGEVIDLSLNEVSAPESKRLNDNSGAISTLMGIVHHIEKSTSTDLYKFSVSTYGGANVIRHTPIGSKSCREPGDNYLDMEVHLQVRFNY
jgi:hypothetical protein